MALNELFKNMIFACFGMQEMLKDFVSELVKKGKMSDSEAAKVINEFMSKSEEAKENFKESIKEIIQKTLQGMNLPTRDEVDNLKSLINELNVRIAKIEEELKD